MISPITYSIKLDMEDTGVRDTGIRLKQGDSGISLYLYPLYKGKQYFDSDNLPNAVFKKPNGKSVIGQCTMDSSGYYIYTFKGNEITTAGKVLMDIKFTLSNGRESTNTITFECVADTVTNDLEISSISPEDLYSYVERAEQDIIDLTKKTTEAENVLEDLQGTISSESAQTILSAVETAESAKNLAVASASSAETNANNAQNSANNAESSANNAATSASNAESSASKAKEYCDSSKKNAEDAEYNAGKVKSLDERISANGYGEYAGGKNLLDPNYFASQIIKAGGTGNIDEVSWECSKVNGYNEDLSGISFKENTVYTIVLYGKCKNEANLATNLRIEYTDGTLSNFTFKTKNENSLSLRVTNSDKTISKLKFNYDTVGTYLQPKKCGIFEGVITESDFEPYFPSNKMLSDKTTQIDDNNMLGWVVPEEMPVKNYVDSDGVFHQRVGRLDLSSLTWSKSSNGLLSSNHNEMKTHGNMYCVLYDAGGSNTWKEGCIGCEGGVLWVGDTSYTDAATFKEAMQGIYLYYELAKEITTSVDGNEAVTKLSKDVTKLYTVPGFYELLSATTLDLRTESSQSFSLSDKPYYYDLVYVEFRGVGSDAYTLYYNFIGASYIFNGQTKSIDIYCNGTKYRLGVSFDSSTNTLTLSNSDTSLHLTIMIAGIKINSLPRTGGGEVENPGLS